MSQNEIHLIIEASEKIDGEMALLQKRVHASSMSICQLCETFPRGPHRDIPAFSLQTESPRPLIVLD